MKKILSKIFWSTISSKKKIEEHQQIIRNNEWNSFKNYIFKNSKFLDLGCGAGYYLSKANKEFNCDVTGIDPEPGNHGVGRYISDIFDDVKIDKGLSENLPYENKSFNNILCSHVLEHVNDEEKSLSEIGRVLKDDGLLIIGMPTATMAFITLFSKLIFTTHISILFFIKSIGKKDMLQRLRTIFLPSSHSYPLASTILYDLSHYKVKNWKKTISKHFKIINTIQPYLYPLPEYPQFFKIHKSKFASSSVFFICKKYT